MVAQIRYDTQTQLYFLFLRALCLSIITLLPSFFLCSSTRKSPLLFIRHQSPLGIYLVQLSQSTKSSPSQVLYSHPLSLTNDLTQAVPNKREKMAPTKTTRGRGRPKSSDSPAVKASPAPAAPSAPAANSGVKRGRGRPPKDPSGLPQRVLKPDKVSKPGTGRGRGRPPKNSTAAATPKKAAATGTGRRGRPPGSTKKPSAAATKAAEAAVAGTGVTKGKKTARGGPGRSKAPAKAADNDEEENDEEVDAEHNEVEEELGENFEMGHDADDGEDAEGNEEDGGE